MPESATLKDILQEAAARIARRSTPQSMASWIVLLLEELDTQLDNDEMEELLKILRYDINGRLSWGIW